MDEIVTEFKSLDADLRVVASLRPNTWEIEYLREDIQSVYSGDDFEDAYRSLMANQVSSADFSQVGPLGDIVGQMYYLKEVVVFQFPSSRYEGIFVSYDQSPSFPFDEAFDTADRLPTLGAN